MSDWKAQIQDLVSASKLSEALNLAKQAALGGQTGWDTPVALMRSELEYLRQNEIRGTISQSDLTVRQNQIASRLLMLVDDWQTPPAGAPAPVQEKTVLLFLGANPFHHLALELEREVELISAGLERFGKRQEFDFRAKMHVTPADLQEMLLEADLAPRFVHFAGNAVVDHPQYGSGLVFEDEHGNSRTVSGEVLARVFKQFPSVECVFLNTCDSGPCALAVGQQVPYAIGMNARIYDDIAIEFALAFYQAIASGKDIPFAFDFAKSRLMMSNFPEQASIPILVTNGQCPDPVYVDGSSHIDVVPPQRPMR